MQRQGGVRLAEEARLGGLAFEAGPGCSSGWPREWVLAREAGTELMVDYLGWPLRNIILESERLILGAIPRLDLNHHVVLFELAELLQLLLARVDLGGVWQEY